MNTETKKMDIGPGPIAKPSQKGGPAFALSSEEWCTIQVYVTNAQSKEYMPHTKEDFRAYLGSSAPSDLSDFDKLIKAYSDIYDHVTEWNDHTFPESISLASDVVAYSIQAPTYYNPIIPLAEKLDEDPNDEKSKKKLQAILDKLILQADDYHSKAEAVYTKIKKFADQTAQDKIALGDIDPSTGLYKYYQDKYGSTSAEVKSLNDEIAAQQIILDTANKEYAHDVVVAATTPTYAWATIFGFIAAAVVAGVYGKKAVEALERGKAAQKKIDELNGKVQVDANLMKSLTTTLGQLNVNIESVTAALPIIQKMQGGWKGISDDLKAISTTIKTNIQDVLPMIMDLGVETAINQWKAVGEEADAYRVNAYITVQAKAA